MCSKKIKYSLIFSSSVFLFKYFYDKLLKDEVYLESLSNEIGETDTEKAIKFLLEKAKKLEESNHYDSAFNCYVNLVKDYCLDPQTVSLLILKEETRIMFNNKNNKK